MTDAMNRAQRREHGHLLERVCPRCRTRLRRIEYPNIWDTGLNAKAICDDCGRIAILGPSDLPQQALTMDRLVAIVRASEERANAIPAVEIVNPQYVPRDRYMIDLSMIWMDDEAKEAGE